jgi:hypothetical protein
MKQSLTSSRSRCKAAVKCLPALTHGVLARQHLLLNLRTARPNSTSSSSSGGGGGGSRSSCACGWWWCPVPPVAHCFCAGVLEGEARQAGHQAATQQPTGSTTTELSRHGLQHRVWHAGVGAAGVDRKRASVFRRHVAAPVKPLVCRKDTCLFRVHRPLH